MIKGLLLYIILLVLLIGFINTGFCQPSDRWIQYSKYTDENGTHSVYYDSKTIEIGQTKTIIWLRDYYHDNPLDYNDRRIDYTVIKFVTYCTNKTYSEEQITTYYTDGYSTTEYHPEIDDIIPETISEGIYFNFCPP